MDIRKNWKPPTRSAPAEAIVRPPQPSTKIKCQVAARQLRLNSVAFDRICATRKFTAGGLGKLLDEFLTSLCVQLGCKRTDLRLDHQPALVLREYDPITKKFTPDANDSYFLRYMPHADHQIKTTVRGDGAQRSDIAERQHRRRLDENRGLRPKKQSRKIESRGFETGPRVDRKWWGKRAFAKGRKMQSRGWR